MSPGYIYIRSNEYWDIEGVYKLGKTGNIADRNQTYITSELRRGYYIMVIEIDYEILDITEKQLQYYFIDLNVRYNGGIEFYKKEIVNLIIPYIQKNNISYKLLSNEEINSITRTYIPRNYQNKIIQNSFEYFKENTKGLLIIPCGTGKTLISLWITKKINLNKIIIGVPNKLLLYQWKGIINTLFKDIPYLLVSGNITLAYIKTFLTAHSNCILITTYASSYKIHNITKELKYQFDMKILDEAHHLTTPNMSLSKNTKSYIKMLKIKSVKQLALTATIKLVDSIYENIISNDDVKYFGNIIDKKSLLWAINKNIVCDYVIQIIMPNEDELEMCDNNLFLSAFIALKSIFYNNSHHLLIYSNNKENSLKIIQYIKKILNDGYFKFSELYFSNYHSEMSKVSQKEILNNFEKSKYGIISCVYCLGEGWDLPLLDGVVFAENMTSNIRIVQSALRASRKNNNEPNKLTKIILPIIGSHGWLDNPDFKKIKEVIYQLGAEDETITEKIKVFKTDIVKEIENYNNTIGEYEDELTQTILLQTIKRSELYITYEIAKKIIATKNIKNKQQYYELCEVDKRLPKDPEKIFGTYFINWIDYLSIELVYYNLNTCKTKIKQYLTKYPEIITNYLDLDIVCIRLCEIDPLFPPNDLWIDYYNLKHLNEIIIKKRTTKNKRKVIL